MDFAEYFDILKSYYHQTVMGIKHIQFGTKAQLAFLEDLNVLVNDGVPPNRAVDMMAAIATGINRDVATELSQKIAQGQPLAEGMREWFSMNVVEIIRVGESGGALGETIKSAINMLSQRGVAIGAFVAAVAYPLLVLLTACFVIIYLDSAVFSQFKAIKPVEQWPSAGQRLIALSQVLSSWWWLFILIGIGLVLLIRRMLSNYTGEIRALIDQYPPFSLYRRLVAARFLETLGLLVANGVVFKSALRVMQYQANPYLHSHLMMMEHLLAMGRGNIADVLDTGLVDAKDLMRLRIMAEVKGFEHGLVRMGVSGTAEVTATLKIIATIIGGVLLILGGILVIMVIQGIYMTGMSMGT